MKINKAEKFLQKVDLDKYQIFICASPLSIPFNGFLHAYIVVNEKSKLTRWDVWHIKNRVDTSVGYVHKNTYKPWTGLGMLYGDSIIEQKLRWPIFIINTITGEKESLAYKMCDFINTKAFAYPLKDKYNFLGPNSNTFVRWYLNYFPEAGIKLPIRAFGGNCAI